MKPSNPYGHLYGSGRWKRIRRDQLRTQPLCEYHLARDQVVIATIADHVDPHKGDEELFWDGKLQSLCKQCHDSDKQREERGGKIRQQFAADGWPIGSESDSAN